MYKLPLSDEYVAGWWDGEGCFRIQVRPKPNGRMSVELLAQVEVTYQPIIEVIHAQFPGGYMWHRQPKVGKPVWGWRIRGKAAAQFAERLEPYLHEKKVQARLLIDAASAAQPWASNPRVIEIAKELKQAKKLAFIRPVQQ